jgi:tRNA (adenine22-N1)-methyltransferase
VPSLILEEKGHIYEILVADYNNHCEPMTEQEIKFGPKLLQNFISCSVIGSQ